MASRALSDSDGGPLDLPVKQAGETRRVAVDYAGGHRYPHLDPIEGARLRLDEIHAPRTGGQAYAASAFSTGPTNA